jgi:sirohydrochlorin cobaltochelatase
LSGSGEGWLLVGHGTREPRGLQEFLATAALVAQRATALAIEPCFLEFAQPTIDAGFRALVERGARRVVVVPALLFAAGHARRDIPAAVAAVAAEYPEVLVEQTEHLGCHETVIGLSKARYDEALAGEPRVPDEQTALVMVGRGSHDASATAEMRQFVEIRRAQTPRAHAQACFVAMAEPSLPGALDAVARLGVQRVVVQPHLLFGGALSQRIESVVDGHARKHPQIQWLTTACLGPSPLLAEALWQRASALLPTYLS